MERQMAVNFFSPQIEAAYTNNTTVGSATYVRIFNGHTADHVVNIGTAANVLLGSVTVNEGAELYIKKEPAHLVNVTAAAGATSVKLCQVDF